MPLGQAILGLMYGDPADQISRTLNPGEPQSEPESRRSSRAWSGSWRSSASRGEWRTLWSAL